MASLRYGLLELLMLHDVCGEAREISSIVSLATSRPTEDAVQPSTSGIMRKAAGATVVRNIAPGVPGEYSELEQPDGCGYRSSVVLSVSRNAPTDADRAGGYAPVTPGQQGKPKTGGNGFQAFR
ncbi:hypothetical protein V5799_013682 [Amblyomma americanum]|uniref:Secreted protein n=1 Tax=Amblyomma americanum TaxID=6943 RepID=A0AAQ4E591_AMBAM